MEKNAIHNEWEKDCFLIKVINSFTNPAFQNILHSIHFYEKHGHAIEEHDHVIKFPINYEQ